jgi:O-antigen/teichoic acid export membrane protein
VTDRSASRALLGRGSVYTLATAMQLAGALLVQPVLSRMLPKDEFGVTAIGIVVTATLGLLITLGLPGVITREYFQGGSEGNGAGVGPLITLSIAVAVLCGAVAFGAGWLWAAPLGGFTAALMIATVTAVSYSIIVTGQAVQRARNEAGRFVLVVGINVLGGQLLGLAAIMLISRTATTYLLGVAAGSLVGAALALYWARPSLYGVGDKEALREWFAIALPTVPHMAALYLMTAGDRYVVQSIGGEVANAEYSLAYLTGALGITLVAAANNAWAPLIYGTPDDRRWTVLATTTQDMLRLAAIVASGLAMAAPLALWIVADPDKYDIAELTPVVALTALATVPYVLYLASAHVLFWTGKTTALIWITPVAVALSLVAKALVLPEFGFEGLAIVTVASYGLLALLVGSVRRRLAEVPWRRRWPEFLGAGVLCVAGGYLPPGWVGNSVRVAVIVGLVGLLLLVLKQLQADRKSALSKPAADAPRADQKL